MTGQFGRRARLIALFGVSVFLLAACNGRPASAPRTTPPGETEAPVQTDARIYYLEESADRFDAEAVATYTNRTGRQVFFERCKSDSQGPVYRIRRVGANADRRSLVFAVWACVGGVPTGALPPGGTLTARVWLGSTKSPGASPPDEPEDRIGTFQITFELCREHAEESGKCQALPDSERVSNEFEVRFKEQ
ncbi:MAG: hypothetical protein WDA27_13410 [Actinomycetota bacterium]